jgi:hypothetical protein
MNGLNELQFTKPVNSEIKKLGYFSAAHQTILVYLTILNLM